MNEVNKEHSKIDKLIDSYDFQQLWKTKCSQFDNLGLSLPSVLPAVERIIVLGDVHGDMKMLKKSLKLAKLIDEDNEWIGKDTVVVQVGDQIDRCRYAGVDCSKKEATQHDEGNDWAILKFMTELNAKAHKSGGAVYSLVGNHELMNVNSDMRYVSYEGFKEFDNWKPPETYIMPDGLNGEKKREWAFKPGNYIADFLACTRQMSLMIGSNLFVHAGILPKIAKKYSIENLNKLLALYLWDELKKEDKEEHKNIWSGTKISPLWIRDFGKMGMEKEKSPEKFKKKEDERCKELIEPIQDIYKVDKIYIGHTPLMKNGISSICNDKIWLTDYGASKAFDKFDEQIISQSAGSESSDDITKLRDVRKAHVLEILNDGEQINIIRE